MFQSGYVAIVGRPNAGKSTLLNTILKSEISIVTPKEQTTRDTILGIYTVKKGQIIFIDTPGIHTFRKVKINELMMQEVFFSLENADLIWYLMESTSSYEKEQLALDLLSLTKKPIFLIINKADKKKHLSKDYDLIFKKSIAKKRYFISALQAEGLEQLLKDTWEEMPEGGPFYSSEDQISDRPIRFFVGEKIREQIYLHCQQEIPYASAIEIRTFRETTDPIYIEAIIYVERESQKGIVIGKQAKKIKQIGQEARIKLEAFLACKIFLDLKVKVLEKWSEREDYLKKMGYITSRKSKLLDSWMRRNVENERKI